MKDFKDKLKNLPMQPGVYIMKDDEGTVIYVGKAKALKNRVNQYFHRSANHSPKTLSLVSNIDDFEYIITDSEVEALVLECNLIKKYKPKYNILLKDDKQYPYIKITFNEQYPRIILTRRIEKDGARYFGPYMSAFTARDNIEFIKKIFKIRSCSKVLPRDIGKGRPCLYYHIGQCSAPCAKKISAQEYNELFRQIAGVLEGKYEDILKQLTNQMMTASENLEFERAARSRDKIENIRALGEKQKVTSTQDDNRDIIGVFKENDGAEAERPRSYPAGESPRDSGMSGSDICIQMFYMRGGKVVGTEYFVFEDSKDTEGEVLSGFIKQFYFNSTNIPKEILLSCEIDDKDIFENWISQKAGHKIYVSVPKRGEKASMLKMVVKNAQESLNNYKFKRDKEETQHNDVLSELMGVLGLERPPFKIESYDISNISGSKSVGVCVVYKNAKPFRSGYRKFNIKTVDGANDYESMREVIYRRINQAYSEQDKISRGELTEDKAKFIDLPDLILLDGGKGHVSTIKELFATMGEDILVFGMVKDDKHRTRGLTSENNEFEVEKDSELFKFLTRMQDEVHRFAISAYRSKHEKEIVKSQLEDIEGIGQSKRIKLLSHFESMDRIKQAELSELESVLDKRAARNVYDYFRKGK